MGIYVPTRYLNRHNDHTLYKNIVQTTSSINAKSYEIDDKSICIYLEIVMHFIYSVNSPIKIK